MSTLELQFIKCLLQIRLEFSKSEHSHAVNNVFALSLERILHFHIIFSIGKSQFLRQFSKNSDHHLCCFAVITVYRAETEQDQQPNCLIQYTWLYGAGQQELVWCVLFALLCYSAAAGEALIWTALTYTAHRNDKICLYIWGDVAFSTWNSEDDAHVCIGKILQESLL